MKYKQNDTIIDKNGNTRKILGTFREYYILTYDNSDRASEMLWTQEKIDELGYTLQEPEWTPEINQMYYYVNIDENDVILSCWINYKKDINRKDLNIIFPATPKGKEQAKARLLEVVALLKK
jgi:hypothetical protein